MNGILARLQIGAGHVKMKMEILELLEKTVQEMTQKLRGVQDAVS